MRVEMQCNEWCYQALQRCKSDDGTMIIFGALTSFTRGWGNDSATMQCGGHEGYNNTRKC